MRAMAHVSYAFELDTVRYEDVDKRRGIRCRLRLVSGLNCVAACFCVIYSIYYFIKSCKFSVTDHFVCCLTTSAMDVFEYIYEDSSKSTWPVR